MPDEENKDSQEYTALTATIAAQEDFTSIDEKQVFRLLELTLQTHPPGPNNTTTD